MAKIVTIYMNLCLIRNRQKAMKNKRELLRLGDACSHVAWRLVSSCTTGDPVSLCIQKESSGQPFRARLDHKLVCGKSQSYFSALLGG